MTQFCCPKFSANWEECLDWARWGDGWSTAATKYYVINDSTRAPIPINYCPWCAAKLTKESYGREA